MLSKPLKEVIRTTPFHLKTLEANGILILEDLLMFFPRTYEDRSKFVKISQVDLNVNNNIKGEIKDISFFKTPKGYKLVKADFEDEDGILAEIVWFNQQHILRDLKKGDKIVISGKPKYEYRKITFTAPSYEHISDETEMTHFGRIIPIYVEVSKLSTEWFRGKMNSVIKYADYFEEILPPEIIKEKGFLSKKEAIKELHFPTSIARLKQAQKRIAFEELFILQIRSLQKKLIFQKSAKDKATSIKIDTDFVKEFLETVGFEFTEHQKISAYQILKDMEKDYPMLRLLEGDVGSGKTVVATLAAIHAIKKGNIQVALMAPTEILATQHYEKIAVHLSRWGVNTKFLSGSMTLSQKKEVYEGVASGRIDFLIGTHALIQDKYNFRNLGLVIIDEQHRFGVEQRKKLENYGFPHVLYMTATPIPRTLALTIYGDQDLSIISQMPKGRKSILTRVVSPHQKEQMYRFIKDQIAKGRQTFIICPLIEESEKLEDVKAVTKEYAFLKEHIFPENKLALLHGKIKADEKNQIMQDFKDKKYDILVATSVIEVGIDIPNATVIVIEGAERFGLSQLHQFRGRVGRNDMQSYCFLCTTKSSSETNARLKAMEKTNDGFKLAEIDLQLRGPGEVYGTAQSGIPDLKMANFSDLNLVIEAREAALEILTKDLELTKYPKLRQEVKGER